MKVRRAQMLLKSLGKKCSNRTPPEFDIYHGNWSKNHVFPLYFTLHYTMIIRLLLRLVNIPMHLGYELLSKDLILSSPSIANTPTFLYQTIWCSQLLSRGGGRQIPAPPPSYLKSPCLYEADILQGKRDITDREKTFKLIACYLLA